MNSLSLICFSLMGRQPHDISSSIVAVVQLYSPSHTSCSASTLPLMQALLDSSSSHERFDLNHPISRLHSSFPGRVPKVPFFKIYPFRVPLLLGLSFVRRIIHSTIQSVSPSPTHSFNQQSLILWASHFYECYRGNNTRSLLSWDYLPVTGK